MSDEQETKQRFIDHWNNNVKMNFDFNGINMWATDVDLHLNENPPHYILHLQEIFYWSHNSPYPRLKEDGRTDRLRYVLPSVNSPSVNFPPVELPD